MLYLKYTAKSYMGTKNVSRYASGYATRGKSNAHGLLDWEMKKSIDRVSMEEMHDLGFPRAGWSMDRGCNVRNSSNSMALYREP